MARRRRTADAIDQRSDLGPELACLGLDRAQPANRDEGQPCSDRVGRLNLSNEAPRRQEPTTVAKRAGLGAIPGSEREQEGVEAIADPRGLGDEMVTSIHEERSALLVDRSCRVGRGVWRRSR